MTLTRYSRFEPRSFAFNPLVDDLLRGFFVRPVGYDAPAATPGIRLDVEEQNGAYYVQAELPGVRREDMSVTVDGANVTLTVEAKREREANSERRLLHGERAYGKASRSFSLPEELDEAAVEAKYRDGVLELRLPKKQAPARKTITIQ